MAKRTITMNIPDLKINALLIFFKYKEFMKKKGHTPITRVKIPNQILRVQIGSYGQLGQIELLLKKLKKKLVRQKLKLSKL